MRSRLVNLALLCMLGAHGCGDGNEGASELSTQQHAVSESNGDAEAHRRLAETDARLEALITRLQQLPDAEQALAVIRAHQARVRKLQAERP